MRGGALAAQGRTLDASNDEGREGGIGEDDERGKGPEVLSVEEKTLYFAEPPSSPHLRYLGFRN